MTADTWEDSSTHTAGSPSKNAYLACGAGFTALDGSRGFAAAGREASAICQGPAGQTG